MLLKAIFLFVLVYLALRTVMNLARAIWVEPQQSRRIRNDVNEMRVPRQQPPASKTPRRPFESEVEDAQWVDLG